MSSKRRKSYTYSDLNEDTIHHIFSFLTRKEAVKTSLLCKSWHQAWMSYPVLKFDEYELFPGRDDLTYSSEDFTEFMSRIVDDSMETFVSNSDACGNHNSLVMEKFHLSLFGRTRIKYGLIKKWVDMALESRVQNLYLGSNYDGFCIPKTLFSGKSLKSLALMGWYMRIPALKMRDLDLCSLRSLSIHTDCIDCHTLQFILSSCPLLEDLHLECPNVTKIKIPDFRNLKILKVGRSEEVEINTLPCLESFFVLGVSCNLSIDIKDVGLYSVRSLSIDSDFNDHRNLQSILSKCPLLEDLHLKYICNTKTKISGCTNLKLLEIGALKEVEITALPCLKSLCMIWYYNHEMYLSMDNGQKIRCLTLVKDDGMSDNRFYKCKSTFPFPFSFDQISLPSASKAFVLKMDPMNKKSESVTRYWILLFYVDTLYWHYKLRQSFSSISQKHSTLTLSIIENEWEKNESLDLSGRACVVKKLKLKVIVDPSRYSKILCDLFSICHPLILCLWAAEEDKDFIKLMCEGFIGKGDRQCWQRELRDAKIKKITGRKRTQDYGPMELNALINLLPSLKVYHKIYFRLRWMV